MAKISAAQVKELRDKTGVGMMDAKKALVAVEGDMEKAIDFLREKGMAKAAKKSDRVAAEGLANVAVNGNKAVIVEVNAETDFVAQNDQFKALVKHIADVIAENTPADVEAALQLKTDKGTLNDELIEATQVIGEKISLRRFEVVEKADADNFGAYLHDGGRIAVLSVVEGADEATAKDVAMHVAAINPKYVNRDEVPEATYFATVKSGSLTKSWSSNATSAKYVASKNGKVKSFVRYEVGEGIEKKEENFAEEVMSQIK